MGREGLKSLAKTDLSQDKWKESDLSNASDRANPVISQDPMDHDPGHLKV